MILTIHQPEAYPQLGLFNKIANADTFIFLDNVQYRKNYFQNRNRIITKTGWIWLTHPIVDMGPNINDKFIDERSIRKVQKTLKNVYGKNSESEWFVSTLDYILGNSHSINLADYNIKFVQMVSKKMGLNTDFFRSSQFNLQLAKSDLIVGLCRLVNSSDYLSGLSGAEYLDLDLFNTNKINVFFQDFKHIPYVTSGIEFQSHASIVSVVCGQGWDRAVNLVKMGWSLDE